MFRLPQFCRPGDGPLTESQKASGRKFIVLYSLAAMFAVAVLNPRILSLLALRLDPSLNNTTLSMFFFVIPFASVFTVLAGPVIDRYGKKAVFVPLASVTTLGPVAILLALGLHSQMSPRSAVWLILSIVAVSSITRSAGNAGWFPLITDCIPASTRGRFFGMLRTCWQIAMFGISLGIAWYMGEEPSVRQFQVLMLVAIGGQIGIASFAAALPEAPVDEPPKRVAFFKSLVRPLRNRGYRNFLIFTLLFNFSVAFQGPFALKLLKSELFAGDGDVVFLTAFASLGAIASLYLMGRMVDRFGSRFIFALLLPPMVVMNLVWVFVSPEASHWKLVIALLSFGYGACQFGASVAMTNMMLSSTPRRNQAAYMGLHMMVGSVAMAIAPFAATGLAWAWVEMGQPFGLSDNRAVFVARIVLTALPMGMLAVLSRRHGGHLRRSAGEFKASLGTLRMSLMRWRNS